MLGIQILIKDVGLVVSIADKQYFAEKTVKDNFSFINVPCDENKHIEKQIYLIS